MGSRFDDDFATAAAQLTEAFGVQVAVCRGTSTSDPVAADVGTSRHEVDDEEPGRTIVTSRDYAIDVALYTVDGEVVKPQERDEIAETIDGVAHRFAVLPIGGQPAFQPVEPDRRRWLLRTREVR